MAPDQIKLNAFMDKFVNDFGAVMHAATIVVGDKLGLYKALAEGPLSAEALAQETETDARYVREWLSAQAASGYVEYDPGTDNFSLTEEQAFALTVEGGPAFIPGAFDVAVAQFRAIPDMILAFRTGAGFGWHPHDAALFHGTERFFRPGYAANLVSTWIPALNAVHDKLQVGAQVADVGCGHGASTVIMWSVSMSNNLGKIFFLTGSSRGLGRRLAEAILEAGNRLIATARQPKQLEDLVQRYGKSVLPLALDVTDYKQAQ